MEGEGALSAAVPSTHRTTSIATSTAPPLPSLLVHRPTQAAPTHPELRPVNCDRVVLVHDRHHSAAQELLHDALEVHEPVSVQQVRPAVQPFIQPAKQTVRHDDTDRKGHTVPCRTQVGRSAGRQSRRHACMQVGRQGGREDYHAGRHTCMHAGRKEGRQR
eukprot:GHVU01074614.1.p1 GENE.GHVU01074614.1~~GHVU01074614.1.p1  ORF type:complete len:161 (+),score=10.83 GHVU01074614.1:680-1162(+)